MWLDLAVLEAKSTLIKIMRSGLRFEPTEECTGHVDFPNVILKMKGGLPCKVK